MTNLQEDIFERFSRIDRDHIHVLHTHKGVLTQKTWSDSKKTHLGVATVSAEKIQGGS